MIISIEVDKEHLFSKFNILKNINKIVITLVKIFFKENVFLENISAIGKV